MTIVIEPGTYDCSNMGDVAMLQMAVSRLRAAWSDARLLVFTNDARALARHCPDAAALPDHGRRLWLSDRSLLGGFHKRLPRRVSQWAIRARTVLRRRAPSALRALIRLKARRHPADRAAFDAFLDAMDTASLHLVCGQGTLADSGLRHAAIVLQTMDMARRAGTPTAMLGQGVGPVTEPALKTLIRDIVPHARVVALREGRAGTAILRSLGVPADCIMVTGDEAVELAYRRRPSSLGTGLGVNLRVAPNAGVRDDALDRIRPVLREFALRRPAPFMPLPIAAHGSIDDARAIRQLLLGIDACTTGGAELDTTEKVIDQAGRCRLVVTGAYHAAIFALAQGVPAVCLSGSAYYAEKFLGLRELFGDGCVIVRLDLPAWAPELEAAMLSRWDAADRLRDVLLESAARQVAWCRAATDRVIALRAPRAEAARTSGRDLAVTHA